MPCHDGLVNWNQVICGPCWTVRNPDRVPVRLRHAEPQSETGERCSFCGLPTNSGIYVRADPATVPFPQPDEDDE